jgi:hypothetical protein
LFFDERREREKTETFDPNAYMPSAVGGLSTIRLPSGIITTPFLAMPALLAVYCRIHKS